MATVQSPRGTRDLLPAEQPAWLQARRTAESIASQMGYQPITVPTYEETALFQRAIGEGTDVIDKELFLVRGKHSDEETYSLRPEGTAGIVRAFVQHGMHTWPQPVRLCSVVNLFRYERPQKGRYREHVQFDIEYFGDLTPFADAWVIYTGWRILSGLGLKDLLLQFNSLGTSEERASYRNALVQYFDGKRDRLSPDSRLRLEKNPLRILDSKDEGDRALSADAPTLSAYLGEESASHKAAVLGYLQAWGIPYKENPFLIRGLDYYCHTAFEWTVTGKGGQQDSLGGGGRYDGLLVQLGGPNVGGVGAGLGLDRIVDEMSAQGLSAELSLPAPLAYLAAADETGREAALPVIDLLLSHGISLDASLGKLSLGSQLKAAGRSGARYAIVLGEQEALRHTATVKDLLSGEQEEVPQASLAGRLSRP